MNRHQRRAAEKQPRPGAPESGTPLIEFDLSDIAGRPQAAPTVSDPRTPPARPSLLTRLLARVLLSRWVLARVHHPDVERLLISFASEANRTEVADELIRRQALRAKTRV